MKKYIAYILFLILFIPSFTFADTELPTKFDLRDVDGVNYTTSVGNQGATGTCWVFSSLASIETNLKYKNNLTFKFSPAHLAYKTAYYFNDGFNTEGVTNKYAGDGGNPFSTVAPYITALKGPILEEDMPWKNYYTGSSKLKMINLSDVSNAKATVDINNIDFIASPSIEEIKSYILEYGAVSTIIYYDENYANGAYLFNNATTNGVHAVSIVGWDDNISLTNFKEGARPTTNGAWIIKNSWGESLGDNGYFYVSYEDNHISSTITLFYNMDLDVPDNVYYYDYIYGNIDSTLAKTYNGEFYTANTFDVKNVGKEVLKEISLELYGGLSYDIYYSYDGNLDNKILIQSGTNTCDGICYKREKLSSPIVLNNSSFSIIIKYYGVAPILSSDSNGILEENKSFISKDGSNWIDLTTLDVINPVKAYTEDIKILFDSDSGLKIYDKDNTTVIGNISLSKENNEIKSITKSEFVSKFTTFDATIYDKDGVTVVNDTDTIKSGMMIYTGEDYYYISIPGDVNGDGKITISDVSKLFSHFRNVNSMTEPYQLVSGDVNGDGKITISDVSKLFSYYRNKIDNLVEG